MILYGTSAFLDHQHFYPKSVRLGAKLMNNNFDNFAVRGAFMMQRLLSSDCFSDNITGVLSEQEAWDFDEYDG